MLGVQYSFVLLISSLCRAESPSLTESVRRRNPDTERQNDAMTVQRAFANTKVSFACSPNFYYIIIYMHPLVLNFLGIIIVRIQHFLLLGHILQSC